MFELKSQHCSFTMSSDGVCCIQTAAGVLENGCIKAAVNRQEQKLAFRPETITGDAGKFIAETSCGRFVLEVTAGKDLKLTLSCELKEFPKEIELTPLFLPEVKAGHAIAQGRRMGRCFNLCFPYEQAGADTFRTSIPHSGSGRNICSFPPRSASVCTRNFTERFFRTDSGISRRYRQPVTKIR